MKFTGTLIACILIHLSPLTLKGQTNETKRIYLDNSLSVIDSSNATFYKLVEFLGNDSLKSKVQIHYLSGALYSITEYSNYPKFIKNGLATRFHKTGKIKSEIEYQNNNYHGKLKTYYDNGQLKRDENYLDGKLIESHCYALDGKDTTNFPYEVSARYPGGENSLMKYLSTNIKYPNKARKKGIEGVVYIATTNYPEKLQERITNRPSRFDRRYKVELPNEEIRRAYIQHKLNDDDLKNVDIYFEY
jgi:protein TonB